MYDLVELSENSLPKTSEAKRVEEINFQALRGPSSSSYHQTTPSQSRRESLGLISDTEVYCGYFKSIGLSDSVFFLATGVCFGFSLRFPGKRPSLYIKYLASKT